jgi:hypothetical protein
MAFFKRLFGSGSHSTPPSGQRPAGSTSENRAEIENEASNLWAYTKATLSLRNAMGDQNPSGDERTRMQLDYCIEELTKKYPSLSKSNAAETMLRVMKTWP